MLALSDMINSLSDAGSGWVASTAHDKFWNINLRHGRGCARRPTGPASRRIGRTQSFVVVFAEKYFICEAMSLRWRYNSVSENMTVDTGTFQAHDLVCISFSPKFVSTHQIWFTGSTWECSRSYYRDEFTYHLSPSDGVRLLKAWVDFTIQEN